MRFNEIYKFSDGTLTNVMKVLKYRVKEYKVNRLNPEHPSDKYVFTMKMEILLDPTSNKILVGSVKMKTRLSSFSEVKFITACSCITDTLKKAHHQLTPLHHHLLVAYSDAATRRSTLGCCIFLGNNLLSWSSKRQPTLSRSSAEVEYRGVSNTVAETCWLRNLLLQHQRTKHIEIDIHFIRDLVDDGQVRVLHVPSCYQFTDIFTKGLPFALFEFTLMDVKRAFLNGELEEKVYMNQPQGFSMPGNENRILYEGHGIAISQSHYTKKVLKKFNYFDCTPVSTPIDTIRKMSRYASNPGTQHRQAILRVLKHLKKIIEYRLIDSGYPSVLEGYTDASSINNTKDNLSTSDSCLVVVQFLRLSRNKLVSLVQQ
nr:ribonuclease H-like domain-containing protein [Tanacetum cinerariifolium]